MFSIQIDQNLSLELESHHRSKELRDLMHINYPRLKERFPWTKADISESEIKSMMIHNLEKYIQQKACYCLIILQEKPIGSIGVHSVNISQKKAKIRYRIDKKYEGQGIVTKSCQKLIDLIHEKRGIQRFVIRADVENIGSRKVAENLGFELEGIEKMGFILHGEPHDMAVYSKIIL